MLLHNIHEESLVKMKLIVIILLQMKQGHRHLNLYRIGLYLQKLIVFFLLGVFVGIL